MPYAAASKKWLTAGVVQLFCVSQDLVVSLEKSFTTFDVESHITSCKFTVNDFITFERGYHVFNHSEQGPVSVYFIFCTFGITVKSSPLTRDQ